jgi:acetolactate synthase-1/2/3 large subunit
MGEKADVVIVLDCVIPWIPASGGPRRDAKIINISADPLTTRYPFKEIEADLLVQGDPCAALRLLREALGGKPKSANGAADSRRKTVAAAREDNAAKRKKLIESSKDLSPVHLAYLAHCINQVKSKDAIVISELGVPLAALDMTEPRSFMGNLLSGGLGFGLGAALGAKLAAPERDVITTVGDGSYMFGNPLPYHHVGRAESLPTLTIIANNSMWGAVRQSTLDVYPEGKAAKANIMPLTSLLPSPDFEKVVESCGGYGEKVETAAAVMPALERAMKHVRAGTPATLNVMTRPRH